MQIFGEKYGGAEGTSQIANIFEEFCDVTNFITNIFEEICNKFCDIANFLEDIFEEFCDEICDIAHFIAKFFEDIFDLRCPFCATIWAPLNAENYINKLKKKRHAKTDIDFECIIRNEILVSPWEIIPIVNMRSM